VQREDGSYGWRDNKDLDFDISSALESNPELLENNPELAQMVEDGEISFEDMDTGTAAQLARALQGGEAGTPWWAGDSGTVAGDRLDFVVGTGQFAEASGIAKQLMENPTNENIGTLNQELMDVQNSGLLVRNEARVGDFDASNPLILANANDYVLNTSPRGFRYRQQTESGEATGFFHEGGDYAVYRSDWSEYNQGQVGVRFNQESTITMQMRGPYGLQMQATGNGTRAAYSHLNPTSVMDYISAFGTQGVEMGPDGMSGVPAGLRFGRVGNTGESTGTHLDLIVEQQDFRGDWEDVDPTSYFGALPGLPETRWSQVYAGHDDQEITREELWNMWKYGGTSEAYKPWEEFMTQKARELGTLLEVWN